MSDLGKIRKNLETVNVLLKRDALPNWKKKCDTSLQYYTGPSFAAVTAEQKGILKRLCETPYTYLRDDIVGPLNTWLGKYDQLLQRKLALTGPDAVDKFIRDGVNHVYRFTVIGNYFREFPSFFVDESNVPSVTTERGRIEFKKRQELKAEYATILNTQLSRLLGCQNMKEITTKLLAVVTTVKKKQLLNPVAYKIKYLKDTCNNLSR